MVALAILVLSFRSAGVHSDPVFFAGTPPAIAQVPLYLRDSVPPLNMLVMGKDHKIYYEAYNDASDLDGDGLVDVGYRGWEPKSTAPTDGSSLFKIDYYGYFDSYICYDWDGDKFVPRTRTTNKRCSGNWSGDFLNYATMSRMDVLRRVLYGGWRATDTARSTVLQGAFFPQDAHSWGKEYFSVARDGYDIRHYTPLGLPASGRYHLFAVTTFSGNFTSFPNYHAPRFRVLRNTTARVWNWVAIEGPVAGDRCFNQGTSCEGGGTHPGHPTSRTEFDRLEATYAVAEYRQGTTALAEINCRDNNCNPHGPDDNYLTIVTGTIDIDRNLFGTSVPYQFRVHGDDAIDFALYGANGQVLATAGCYGGRGFDATCGTQESAVVSLTPGARYTFKFRHEEATGGDGYRLQFTRRVGLLWTPWQTLGRNTDASIQTASATFYNLAVGGATLDTDRFVRVEACPDTEALRDSSCRAYPSGAHKPTGILHEYGEEQRMYFGLITGTQRNNLQGGVLRRNIENFADEVDASTGVFSADVEGIVRSIDRLRMIGGGYNGGGDNVGQQKNWNWANAESNLGGNCESQGGRALANGECRMWGNPIAEMMFEAVRYFAGAGGATDAFVSEGNADGTREDTHLGLAEPAWRDPYRPAGRDGGGYASCSRPVMTVISDINPSYDGDLPGSAFGGSSDSALENFDAAGLGQAIWNDEFGSGPRNVFIGEAGGISDGAPTPKAASSFGDIRGLAPEEPTKEGTYYSASVARYAATNRLNSRADFPYLTTYAIALASPLPRMSIPVGGRTVELIPFAKTVSGTFGEHARKPTNTIVDFFVESMANFPGQTPNSNVNSGRAHAVFRINYEDVEQGNDHDMDAIVRYEISAGTNSLTVRLTSEYAAGSANQNIGYVISGTTRDGVYLEVRDSDSQQANSVYELNTPQGRWAGECVGQTGSSPCNQGLGTEATRTFTAGSAGVGIQLRDPLWYAAKYGTPTPQVEPDGEPSNYFLVTNPLNLRAQLAKAFDSALDLGIEPGSAGFSGARIGSASFTVEPSFRRARNGKDWTGNLTATAIRSDGTLGSTLWTAQQAIASGPRQNIWTIHTLGTGQRSSREASRFVEMPGADLAVLARLGVNPALIASRYGRAYTADQIVEYIAGDQTLEAGQAAGGTLRARSSVLGSIVNSEPVVASPRADFGYAMYEDAMFDGYQAFLTGKREADKTYVYVGANDGMLHAFDASTRPCTNDSSTACRADGAGQELFGFVPNGVLSGLGALALPDDLYQHRYYVDGQITVTDARQGRNWRTLLAGTTGGGGRSVFVLDVTNPGNFSASNVLWERNGSIDNDLGNTYGKPLIVPLENGSWGVLFGNGYGGNTSDPSLYVLDAFTGAEIARITAADREPATRVVAATITEWICSVTGILCAKKTDPFNGLGQITAIDRNGNGKVDTIYGGDLQGNLWKFDLSGTNASAWAVANSGSPLFVAEVDGVRQPITGGIRVAAGPGTGVMVFFGTGRYLFASDNTVPEDPDLQSLYGIFDNGSAVSGGRSALEQQAITGETTTTGGQLVRNLSRNLVRYFGDAARRGWYIDLAVRESDPQNPDQTRLARRGERFIATPLIQSGRVFFTTYTPMEDSCNPGGRNFVYGLDLLSGAGGLSDLGVLPGGESVCTGGDCGAVSIDGENGGGGGDGGPPTSPPITNLNLGALDTLKPIDPDCVGPDCATYEECSVVIYPGGFVLPRPCGRQSWRQLR
nr:PilC/PilY family type IV pilus protein [Luteimonas sp. Y-2-2-4F]